MSRRADQLASDSTLPTISDQPVFERGADLLGRWTLATTIFRLVSEASGTTAATVGVYGGWGEGKTSVLRFIEAQGKAARIPVCWFSVWQAQTQADLWGSLFGSLSLIPGAVGRPTKARLGVFRWLANKGEVADANEYSKAAHRLGQLVLGVRPHDVQEVVGRIRHSGRVIIFVDDIDRVEARLVPKLLMGLHQIFEELRECSIVVALDPDSIAGALSQVNPAWTSASEFLEKIVHYPFWLPRLNEEQKRRLVSHCLEGSRLTVSSQTVFDLIDLVPSNPRKIKQLVRALQRFHPVLRRLGADEWNPTMLVLIELMRLASADVAEDLIHDRAFLQEFAAGNAFVRPEELHENRKITKEQFKRIKAAVDKAIPNHTSSANAAVDQIVEVTATAIETLFAVTADDAYRHATLDRHPPVVTMREAGNIFEEWRVDKSAADLKKMLSRHAATVERSDAEVLEGLTQCILRRREELIGQASETLDADESAQFIRQAESLFTLIRQLVEELDCLGPNVPGRVDLFISLRNQVVQASNRLSEPQYATSREQQRSLLYSAASRLRDVASDVLTQLNPLDQSRLPPEVIGEEEQEQIRSRLREIFGAYVAEEVVERFKRPGGIAAVLRVDKHPGEAWLLLAEESPLHRPPWRAKLKALTGEADQVIAFNFLTYLRALMGMRGDTVRPYPLAKDPDLVIDAWRVASRFRAAARMQPDIVKLGKALRENLPKEHRNLIDVPELPS